MASVYAKNSAEMQAAKSLLHDLTYVAGLRSDNQRTNISVYDDPSFVQQATIVCEEVINRSFNDIDSAINKIANVPFANSLTKAKVGTVFFQPWDVAVALVYLAECLNLYWDDLSATQYELDAFKNTLLGKAVERFGRFTSVLQAAQAGAPVQTQAPGTRSARSTKSSNARGGQPKNNYKQSGGQSANVRDLKGAPGTKLIANGPFVYRIIGDNSASKNIPTAFVRPLSASGAQGNTNKVFLNSGNGYTDCPCWFDDINDANDFLAAILSNLNIPSSISNLRVVKSKADKNGYYIVGTVLGNCAISARKLNEALEEQLNQIEEDFSDDLSNETNGWELVGARMTNEDFEKLALNMQK